MHPKEEAIVFSSTLSNKKRAFAVAWGRRNEDADPIDADNNSDG